MTTSTIKCGNSYTDGVRFFNFQINNLSSLQLNISSNTRALLFGINNFGAHIMTQIYCDGSGTVGAADIDKQGVNYSGSANQITLTNGTDRQLRCCFIILQGNIYV